MPAYPPRAKERVYAKGNGEHVSEQPKAGMGMNPSMAHRDPDEQNKPMRLRGGCIPLPVSCGISYEKYMA